MSGGGGDEKPEPFTAGSGGGGVKGVSFTARGDRGGLVEEAESFTAAGDGGVDDDRKEVETGSNWKGLAEW